MPKLKSEIAIKNLIISKMNIQHAFIAIGNSMDNGIKEEAIIDGSVLVCSEIKLNDLRRPRSNNYVFLINEVAFLCRVKFYSKEGVFVNFINPDKNTYPEVNIALSSITKIYKIAHFSKIPIKEILELH